jgi:malate/lactate dehydrogenase
MPLRTLEDGSVEIVQDVVLSEFAKEKIKISTNELLEERAAVEDLLK